MSKLVREFPVQRLAGELRWLVRSDNGRDEYLVDLEAFGLNGACTCPHFDFKILPLLKRGAPERPLRCKHIIRAKIWHSTDMLKMIIKARDGEQAFKHDRMRTYGEQ